MCSLLKSERTWRWCYLTTSNPQLPSSTNTQVRIEQSGAPAHNLLCSVMLDHVSRFVHQLLHRLALHLEARTHAITDLHATLATLSLSIRLLQRCTVVVVVVCQSDERCQACSHHQSSLRRCKACACAPEPAVLPPSAARCRPRWRRAAARIAPRPACRCCGPRGSTRRTHSLRAGASQARAGRPRLGQASRRRIAARRRTKLIASMNAAIIERQWVTPTRGRASAALHLLRERGGGKCVGHLMVGPGTPRSRSAAAPAPGSTPAAPAL
jgi:hypothetical protein